MIFVQVGSMALISPKKWVYTASHTAAVSTASRNATTSVSEKNPGKIVPEHGHREHLQACSKGNNIYWYSPPHFPSKRCHERTKKVTKPFCPSKPSLLKIKKDCEFNNISGTMRVCFF
jgi:hypothetical protein